jgi:hypothetical protein
MTPPYINTLATIPGEGPYQLDVWVTHDHTSYGVIKVHAPTHDEAVKLVPLGIEACEQANGCDLHIVSVHGSSRN